MSADYRALGRRGGLSLASRTDMRQVAAHARKHAPSCLDFWRRRVDPDGVLDASDRDARARAAQRLYFSDLARKSAAARRRTNPNDQHATNDRPEQAAAVETDTGAIPPDVQPSR